MKNILFSILLTSLFSPSFLFASTVGGNLAASAVPVGGYGCNENVQSSITATVVIPTMQPSQRVDFTGTVHSCTIYDSGLQPVQGMCDVQVNNSSVPFSFTAPSTPGTYNTLVRARLNLAATTVENCIYTGTSGEVPLSIVVDEPAPNASIQLNARAVQALHILRDVITRFVTPVFASVQ